MLRELSSTEIYAVSGGATRIGVIYGTGGHYDVYRVDLPNGGTSTVYIWHAD